SEARGRGRRMRAHVRRLRGQLRGGRPCRRLHPGRRLRRRLPAGTGRHPPGHSRGARPAEPARRRERLVTMLAALASAAFGIGVVAPIALRGAAARRVSLGAAFLGSAAALALAVSTLASGAAWTYAVPWILPAFGGVSLA